MWDCFFPKRIIATEIVEQLGTHLSCPWCIVSNTLKEPDCHWSYTPLRKHEPKIICEGCVQDIYSTCNWEDFYDNPYHDLVEEAAKKEGLSVLEFRIICLRHQLEISETNPEWGTEEDLPLRNKIMELLSTLEKQNEKS